MYKAAIFDLDGTIADTVISIAVACNKALVKCGLMERPIEEYNYYAGDGVDTLVKRALYAAGDKEYIHYDTALVLYKEIFEEYCTYEVKAYDDMKETLEYMKSKGMKLAVLTNKPHDRAVTVVESLYGKDLFDYILGQQEGIAKKPDPEGALLVASKLSVNPLECIYVGDTNVDMQTGNASGMYTVGVLWGFRDRKELEENHAHVIIKNPRELKELILRG
ncbi:phosphoglycolate phosphatase [Mobilisporobacter senegalensis]|uniref:Phosphoglycolate phosphatase n=1 Tax=Mobilisporobacter senegalensis TaxID=1329262 RepID=A0A3N1XXT6_9FIRM|nr:HAD family hydrolase [Mobilisporobacter senegalensis]ROR31389.1 phosphoglycolate phosphatase [Mobilisporobacter senegalensis]